MDEALRQLATLSDDPITRRNFMRIFLGGFRFGKDEEPKQKQSQELHMSRSMDTRSHM